MTDENNGNDEENATAPPRKGSEISTDLIPDLGSKGSILLRISIISTKILWITGRALVVGLLIVGTLITDKQRQDRFRRWVLLEGDRWTIVGLLVGAVFVLSLLLTLTNVIGVRESRFVTTMFSTIIAGLFSFVPIVISVNQLTVSRLFETPAGLRERIDSVHEFRVDLQKMIADEPVAPTDPALFLAQVVELVSERAAALQQVVSDSHTGKGELLEDICRYTRMTRSHVEEMDDQLADANLSLIQVLLPMIGDTYSKNVNVARRLQKKYDDTLSDSAMDLLDDLQELSLSLDVLRQYFKAIYIQQELSNLSRLIAVSGTVAFVVSMFLVMLFATGDPSPHHPLVLQIGVSFGLSVAFAPLAILLSFMLRVATIAKQTAAPGAFLPKRETPEYVR